MKNLTLATKQIIVPDTTRGLQYARWKSKPSIETLKSNGLTSSKLEQELQLIHDISFTAYHQSVAVCKNLSLRIATGFALSIASISLVIFAVALSFWFLSHEIGNFLEKQGGGYEKVSSFLLKMPLNGYKVSLVSGICVALMSLSATLAIRTMCMSHKQQLHQYLQSILAVHAHIDRHLCPKYKACKIRWKMMIHKQESKRIQCVGNTQDITYYGIVAKLINNDGDFGASDYELDAIIGIHLVVDNPASKGFKGGPKISDSDMLLSDNDEHSTLADSDAFYKPNRHSKHNEIWSRRMRMKNRMLSDASSDEIDVLSPPQKVDHVPLLMSLSENEEQCIGNNV